jgi:hypothetical protein
MNDRRRPSARRRRAAIVAPALNNERSCGEKNMPRVAVLALLALIAGPVAAQSMFHANAAHTGVYAGAGPVREPHSKWTFKAAGAIVTSPAVVDGVVYIASLSGHLYAIDARNRTGEVELQVADADRIVACDRQRHGVFRVIRGIAGCHRRIERTAEMGAGGRIRAQVRGAEPARLRTREADDARLRGMSIPRRRPS